MPFESVDPFLPLLLGFSRVIAEATSGVAPVAASHKRSMLGVRHSAIGLGEFNSVLGAFDAVTPAVSFQTVKTTPPVLSAESLRQAAV
jgi:hypothetical protein